MSSKTWEYQGSYLEQFPVKTHCTLVNLFCFAIREGRTNIDEILAEVRRQVKRREDPQWGSHISRVAAEILESLGTDEAYWFADHILWRESLSPEARERLQKRASGEYALKAMDQKKPSEKQLAFLRARGCKEIPKTMADASLLIGEYKR